ncbi:karyopherin KAP114 [Ascoidea rubescens DSM 1968]|uniref:ARM repeat-containing protein n=1 Tax=Ascoidea rubescens DSM 1968 TaxID=1344418 RepID=A0A1D2VJ71_9ASCO|nr:ARM repeat-containing protein [Ascoidea rubescens DSM 1968]ODV61668.1 ARM repeat-containing protein [Ascoidea rubescens DSM 1968]
MRQVISDLLFKTQDPNNLIRSQAEQQFLLLSLQNPSSVGLALVQIAADHAEVVPNRQSALLNLKRLVPLYWSFGFTSFKGTAINQETKAVIRSHLLSLICDNDSKIRNSSTYCIVQISVVDYPEEWPDLISVLYSFIDLNNSVSSKNSILGGLIVLSSLFDDLITDDQFFEGSIGLNTLTYCKNILATDTSPKNSNPNDKKIDVNTKIEIAKLLETCLRQFQGPEATMTSTRADFAKESVVQVANLLLELLNELFNYINSNNVLDSSYLLYNEQLYKVLILLINNFNLKQYYKQLFYLSINQLSSLTKFHYNLSVLKIDDSQSSNPYSIYKIVSFSHNNIGNDDPIFILNKLLTQIYQFLSSVNNCSLSNTKPSNKFANIDLFSTLFNSISLQAISSNDSIQNYISDFNSFVTEESGMSIDFTLRDSINEYLSELNHHDSSTFLNWSIQSFLSSINENVFVISRTLIVLSKFIEIFQYVLSDEMISNAFTHSIEVCFNYLQNQDPSNNDSDLDGNLNLIRASLCISLTYYSQFFPFDKFKLSSNYQDMVASIISSLIDSGATDDTPTTLMENVVPCIKIDPKNAYNTDSIIKLIFKISSSDFSNISIINETADAIGTLFENIKIENFIKQCEFGLPLLINNLIDNINSFNGLKIEYSPQLNFSLEYLNLFIKNCPSKELPEDIFKYTFSVVSKLLLIENIEDQILQLGSEILNSILISSDSNFFINYKNEQGLSGIEITLKLAEKFLSPTLSDSAALNIGSIVLSIVSKFSSYLNDYLSNLIQAVTKRLTIATNIVIMENMIMVFCHLVLLSASDTINFLDSIKFEDNKSGLEKVIPIWLDTFTSIRGYEKIKKNILALGKIFMLSDPRIENIIVDGDLIPNQIDPNIIVTRSIAKKMPQIYQKISCYVKILKLFISELSFQNQQPNPSDYVVSKVGENDNEEGWEDLEDLGAPTFEKLTSYIDAIDDADEEDEEKGNLAINQDNKQILIEFFKECAQKSEVTNFRKYYDVLSDEEKKILCDNIIF